MKSPVLSLRDPIHGFISADALETALINSRPLQRLRYIRQLGFTRFVYPGAEHSRFSHVLGAMELAGQVYDALAKHEEGVLDPHPEAKHRRLIRVAALVHDVGHAPFSHSAEELFEDGIDHEEMTCRLLRTAELGEVFAAHGEGVEAEAVIRLLSAPADSRERLLSQIISGELDVDKMDYLRRDSLYCGVGYGNFDVARLLGTVRPLKDPQTGEWGVGVDEGGVHALEAMVMARYYMFTQVYFNVTGKVLELHFAQWLREEGRRWPSDPEAFLHHDDISVLDEMRASVNRHAEAIVQRHHFPIAFQTEEHLSVEEKSRFEESLPQVVERFGAAQLLISNSAKDPHRLGASRVLVRRFNGALEPMEEASHFIRHLKRIDRYRVYSAPEIQPQVNALLLELWP